MSIYTDEHKHGNGGIGAMLGLVLGVLIILCIIVWGMNKRLTALEHPETTPATTASNP